MIELLRQIDADSSLPDDLDAVLSHPITIEVEALATEVLICGDGRGNEENMNELRRLGWGVFPVERDGFGWLIGGIQTKKGVITYG
jgi:hypothetical protein